MHFKKMCSAILTGVFLVSSGVTALGNTNENSSSKNGSSYSSERRQVKDKKCCRDKGKMEDRIKELVEKKIITKEQGEKWLEFHGKKVNQRKEEVKKIKGMSKEEKRKYFEQRKKNKSRYLEELVEEEIISREQADQIKAQKLLKKEK